MADVIGIGLAAWDTVCLFDRYPGRNQKVAALESLQCGGGPVPTALAIFARLGGRAAFVGAIGDDAEGQQVRQDLAGFGVNVDHLIIRPGSRTPCAYIWVDQPTGERTVALVEGNVEPLRPHELPRELLQTSKYLLTDGRWRETSAAAAALCHSGEGEVILDAGSPRPDWEALLSFTDHSVVSADFLSGTFPGLGVEEALRRIGSFGPKAAVVTQGEQGGYWWSNGQFGRYPAFQTKVVDTTGAGDAFHGGYLYGLLQGWDLPQRCRFASAVAALVCRGLGGRSAAPTLQEVETLLDSSPSDQGTLR
ncbi:MAG: PfkB family carbohydrate kinase [bacterium]|nr:PfkB family carbohydrate kinase [bacterium]